MKTFEKFTREIYESDIILSEARSVLVEKDSDAVKQYKKGEKSFKKGFGKNIKPTVVQPGLDLYKAGGPFVPDKTTFKNTGKKVPSMEPKPQFGKPKTTSKAPDRTGLKKSIADVRASEKRLYDAGVGKKPSLVQQRKFTKDKIKELSRQTTRGDAFSRATGTSGSTEGSAGASGSTKTTKPKVTPTKGVNQADVSKKAQEFTQKTNKARIEKNKIDIEKADKFKKTPAYKSIAQGKDSKGNFITPQQRKKDFKNFKSNTKLVTKSATKKPVSFKIPNATGTKTMKDVKLPKFVRDKNLSFRNRSNATTKGGKTVSKSGGSSYKKTIVPELQKRGFKGAAGKRAFVGKGAKLVKAAAKKSPLGAIALGAAGLVGTYYAGKSVFGGKPKDTLTRKDFTKLNKMPGNNPKGIIKKDGSEVRRDFFMTKKQKENKIKQGKDIISTNRKERDKNFTKKLRSGEYFTPRKKD